MSVAASRASRAPYFIADRIRRIMSAPLELALFALTALSALIWLILIFFRGGFWRDGPYISEHIPAPLDWPRIVAVIPARNEAETIGETISSLSSQDYPGAFSIVLVDDQSNDATQEHARAAASKDRRLAVVSGQPLPAGWSGKMWAVAQGIAAAEREAPDAKYILLTDADIVHAPSVLRGLVAKAEQGNLALVSHMVMLRCASFWERLLIPAFIFFFKKLYPFEWINDPKNPTAGAAGGLMLVRRDALIRAGGIECIRHEIIDDCALARTLKPEGPIWLGLTKASHSLRRYEHMSDIWNMVTRTAFIQLKQSLWLLAGTVLGMAIIYLVPPVTAVIGLFTDSLHIALVASVVWLAMIVSYVPTLRLYERPVWWGLLLPLAGFLYTCMTVASAYRTLAGAGPQWKDRHYGAQDDGQRTDTGQDTGSPHHE
jgi:hopene-associated glycosyltransferase HpnB